MKIGPFNSDYNSNDMELGFVGNKRIKISKKSHTFLHLQVLKVEGISLRPSSVNKACSVVSWLDPWDERETYIVDGFPSPYSNTKEIFYLGQYPIPYTYEFLNLEVLRFTSNNEPGTSNGIAIMGKAKIPLPKVFNNTRIECFDLVKTNLAKRINEVVGRILLSMKLEVI